MRPLINTLLIILNAVLLADATAQSGLPVERWSYIVAYEGLFSAGVPVDIAAVHLEFGPAESNGEGTLLQAALDVSTQGYAAIEALFPVRFCYRNRLETEQWATLGADWLSQEGSRITRGRLDFDRKTRQVVRLRARRELDDGSRVKDNARRFIGSDAQDEPLKETKREQQPFPDNVLPMDSLSMILWLREQPLQYGVVLEPAVRDGDDLLGFRIQVEALENLAWNGGERATYRVRLEPRVKDESDVRPTWMWLSRDAERLPLRFRSSRAFGALDAWLVPAAEAVVSRCDVPQAVDLELPPP
jgi:hypothetical protein